MQGQCARCKGKIYFTAPQADSGGKVVCPQCGTVNKLGSSKHGDRVDYYISLDELPKSKKKELHLSDEHLDPEKIQRNYDIVEEYRNKTDFSSDHDLILESDLSTPDDETEKNFRKLIDYEKFGDTSEFTNNMLENEKPAKSGVFEQTANIHVSYGPEKNRFHTYGLYAFICCGVLFLIGLIFFAFKITPWDSDKQADPQKEMEQKILKQMTAEYPAEVSERMTYVKNGEMAFTRDTPDAYAEASDNFGKSFVFSPGNDEITARYAESMVLGGKAGGDIKELQKILEMLDYGLSLKPNSASLHRARARFFLSLGQPDNAMSDARHSTMLEPENPENTIVFAEAQAENNPEAAILALENVISQENFPIIAMRKLADIYFKNGYLAEAEQMWKKRMDIDPENCATCLQSANLYESVGMYSNAVSMYNRLLQSGHDEIEGMAGFSRSLLLSGRHPSYIVEALTPLVTKGPKAENMQQLAEFQVTGAHMYLLMGNYTKAMEYNSEALKADRSNTTARYQSVLMRVIKGEIDDKPGENMIAELADLALYLPKNPEIPTLIGRLHELRMQYPEAITNYIAAIKLDPSYPIPSFFLAALYTENRVYGNAFKVLWRLADYSQDYWEQHPQKNLLIDISGSGERLLSLLGKIEKYEVDIDELSFLSGLVAFINKDPKSAAEYFRAVLRNNPEHIKAASWLAYVYKLENRKTEAMNLLEDIKNLDLQSAYLKACIKHDTLAPEQRINLWENFIKRYENCPGAYVRLAELYHRANQKQKAVAMAQAAFKLDPESLETRSTLYVVGK